jgi:hypothetical protein
MAKKPVILPSGTAELRLGGAAPAGEGAPAKGQEAPARKPKAVAETPPPSAGGGAKVHPRVKEFTPIAEVARWRVERFDLLAVEFGLDD